MYIRVRNMTSGEQAILTVSKTTLIKDLKKLVQESLNVLPENQRLFYAGKQLEDEYTIFDYSINLNDVVQLMERVAPIVDNPEKSETSGNGITGEGLKETKSKYLQVGDLVDILDPNYGAWFEGKVIEVERNCKPANSFSFEKKLWGFKNVEDDGLLYKVQLESDVSDGTVLSESIFNIRPRACDYFKMEELKTGLRVMVNFNIEEPNSRGYWYDFLIEEVKFGQEIRGTLFVGKDRLQLKDIAPRFCEEFMKIRQHRVDGLTEESVTVEDDEVKEEEEKCTHCKNRKRARCKYCGCHVCGGKEDPNLQLMCDECDMAFHLKCLDPPLESLPEEDEWFCPLCKNDDKEVVKAGGKALESKKKAKMASKVNQTSRDWGKGMACVGRTKECTVVPANHYGPIPGVEVGMSWKFRLQVSEAGVHRPHVAGIHGRESDGAYSIVLSGGYEDDVDNGDSFLYTGSGGRDLSGNKRTADQSCDQTLTRMNKALALNCDAPLNQKGAKARNWKKGKPVRVVRNYKLAKHSDYAPEEGNRYDGIYKVKEYYPEKGKSGFIIWRFILERDDPAPAPWTKEGKKRIEELGFEMIYPEGYLGVVGEKENEIHLNKEKRSHGDSDEGPPAKKPKKGKYQLDKEMKNLISSDKINAKIWNECEESLSEGRPKFITVVGEHFNCICCMELVCKPVTTSCKHNFCQACLKRSFQADVYTCPYCRNEISPELNVNKTLEEILLKLFPGYNVGR